MSSKHPARKHITESVASFIKRKNREFDVEKRIEMKDIGRKGKFHFEREAWVFLPQGNLNEKVFIFERLRKVGHAGTLAYGEAWKRDEREYRIGYFIVGKNGRAKGRWVWGQFCPLIPIPDFGKLISKAKRKGVILS